MKTIERLICSYKTSLVLLFVYALCLAFATFIEKYHGTETAKAMVYYSPLLILLQFTLVVNYIAATLKHKLLRQRRWGLMLTHFAFVIILLGALVSHLTGEEGYLHLREGETSRRMVVRTSRGMSEHPLPFSIQLKKFTLTRYPGSSSPSSYESLLRVKVDGETREERVYMNNVMDVKGYRFFQASFDSDEKGTILSVNRDVFGRNITYTGYAVLFLGFILCFVGKNTRLYTLNQRLKWLSTNGKAILLLALLTLSVQVEAKKEVDSPVKDAVMRYAIDPAHAARLGAIPIQSTNGRIIPVNTFSSEILRKIHKGNKVGNFNSDQFLISFLALPEMWMRVPFISLSNNEVADYYGLTRDECAYIELFDSNGAYKLQEKVEEAYNKMQAERTAFDKEVVKLDEKINILHQLLNYQLLNILPKENDPDHKWYAPGDDLSAFAGQDSMFVSKILQWYTDELRVALQSHDWTKSDEVLDMIITYQRVKNKTLPVDQKKLDTEIFYNKANIFRYCRMGYLILGGFLLVLSILSLFKEKKWIGIGNRILTALVCLVFAFHIYGIGLRWYIGGYAPWSNSYETMVYVAWATALGGLLFVRKSRITFALAILFAGIILFVSGLNWMDPQINPLVPVLKSPWLMFHVAVIVAAYGFFGISFLLGATNLVLMIGWKNKRPDTLPDRIRSLSIINEMSLLIGLMLITVGTFLGAIWANESWGRYWGWDPKETWALITVVVYVIVTHLHLVRKANNLWAFNLASVLAFASVLMTFFGVNYFLSGMHSYGQNDAIQGIFGYLYATGIVILLLAAFSYKGHILKVVERETVEDEVPGE